MKRTKLRDRILPDYTKGEEITNMVTHIIGAVFGLAYTTLTVVFAAIHHNPMGVVSCAIYGAFTTLLFIMSSIYHGLHPSTGKKVLQILDHCTIYFMIAGTYTPICLVSIREQNAPLGWTMFGIVWAICVLAVTLNAIDLEKYSKFSMICYLGMGWCVVFTFKYVWAALTPTGVMFILVGGILYTIGAVLYRLGENIRYMHSVFHVFVDAASVMQFFAILFYVAMR